MTQLWQGTDYPPRNRRDRNSVYAVTQFPLPHHSNGDAAVPFFNGGGEGHFSAIPPSYPTYAASFVPSQHPTGHMYMQPPDAVAMTYPAQPPPGATLPSQHRTMPQYGYYPSSVQSHRSSHHSRIGLPPDVSLADTEEQESPNQNSMYSEQIVPPPAGFPDVHDFDDVMKKYVQNLSPKKQDKALIHAKRAANIKAVLIDKKTTAVESAQFRFWVKKMFTLEPRDASIAPRKKKICHDGKPVAIREKLFKILIRAHRQCSHGGRDKTSTQVRRIYSWVPKELISRFVKLCPTCRSRRGITKPSSSPSERSSTSAFANSQSPELTVPHLSRRQSYSLATTASSPNTMQSPSLQMSSFSSTFQHQNRWMTPADDSNFDETASAMVTMNMNSPSSPGGMTSMSPKFDKDDTDSSPTLYFRPGDPRNSAVTHHFSRAGNFVSMNSNLQEVAHHNDHHHRARRSHNHNPLKRERPY